MRRQPSRAAGRTTHRQPHESASSVALEGDLIGHTHTGTLRMPLWHRTGRHGTTCERSVREVFDVEADKISSHRAYWDLATAMAQLGLMRSTKQPGSARAVPRPPASSRSRPCQGRSKLFDRRRWTTIHPAPTNLQSPFVVDLGDCGCRSSGLGS